MKITTFFILCFVFLLLCPLPSLAQHKYYAHGQDDFSYSPGIGTVVEATFADKFSLGSELTWRCEDDISGVITRENKFGMLGLGGG